MKVETIDTHEFKSTLRVILVGEGHERAKVYFRYTLLKSIQIAGGDFAAVLPRRVASIGTEVLGEAQANTVIAECADVLASQVEQSPS